MARHPNDPGPLGHRFNKSEATLHYDEKSEDFWITCDCLDCHQPVQIVYIPLDVYADMCAAEDACEPEPPDRTDEMRDRQLEQEDKR